MSKRTPKLRSDERIERRLVERERQTARRSQRSDRRQMKAIELGDKRR